MFDWSDFLRIAIELAASTTDEAAQRTAIGRAYYAAYGRASEHLLARGLLAPRAMSHHNVWSAFRSRSNQDDVDVWTNGIFLKEQRQKADYRRTFQGSLTQAAQDAIERATAVLNLLDRL